MLKFHQKQKLSSIDHYLQENDKNCLQQRKTQATYPYPEKHNQNLNFHQNQHNTNYSPDFNEHNQIINQKEWMKYYGHRDKYKQSHVLKQSSCSCFKVFITCFLIFIILGLAGFIYWRCGINKCFNQSQPIVSNQNNSNNKKNSNNDNSILEYTQPTMNYIFPQITASTHKFSKQGIQIVNEQNLSNKKNRQVHIRKFQHLF